MLKRNSFTMAIILLNFLLLNVPDGILAQLNTGNGEATPQNDKISFAIVQPFNDITQDKRYDFLEVVLPASLITQLSQVKIENVRFIAISAEPDKQKDIDVWAMGEYSVDQDEIEVSMKIKERAGVILPIEVSTSTDKILEVSETLFRRILETVKGRITPQGEWREEPILFTEAGAEEYLAQGERYYQTKEYDRAILMYRRAMEKRPDDVNARLRLADVYMAQERFEHAVSEYQYLVAYNSNIASAHSGLGIAHFRNGQYDNAISEFEKALNLSPDDPEVCFESYKGLGDVYFAQVQYKKAIDSYLKAENYKKIAGIYHSLGQSYLKTNDFDNATQFFEDGRTFFPESSELTNDLASTYNVLGMRYYNEGDHYTARGYFRRTIDLSPEPEDKRFKVEAYLYDGRIYKRDVRYHEAIEQFRHAYELGRTYQLLIEMGDTYRKMGMYHDAVKQLNQAIELEPGKTQAPRELEIVKEDMRGVKLRDDIAASIASLVVPGLGQHFKGRCWRGLAYEGFVGGCIGTYFILHYLEWDIPNDPFIIATCVIGWAANMIDAGLLIDSTEKRFGVVHKAAYKSGSSLFIPGLGQHLTKRYIRGFAYEGLAIGAAVATVLAREHYSKTLGDFYSALPVSPSESIKDFVSREKEASNKAKNARYFAIGAQLILAGVWFTNIVDAILMDPVPQTHGVALEARAMPDGGRVLVSVPF